MRRIPKFYELTPEDRRTRRLWAQRIAILYGTIALVAFAALAVGSHQSPSNQRLRSLLPPLQRAAPVGRANDTRAR